MPKNIEGYYQETGRAGRDGAPADAWMAYGLQDVVNQRRMIDESPAGEEFKQVMRGKLDALLALAEATDCRRVRLLGYFGENDARPAATATTACNPPQVWDGTDAARKLLCTIYRVQQHSGISFGAGHIMDILRGKATEKVKQFGHERLSTFGLGAEFSEAQLRGVLRQLIATGALAVDARGLQHAAAHRRLARGAQGRGERCGCANRCRRPRRAQAAARAGGARRALARRGRARRRRRSRASPRSRPGAPKWREEHNLPAYVIFHDATLAAIAERAPPRWTTCRASAASAPRSSRPTGAMCCGCAAAAVGRPDLSASVRQIGRPHDAAGAQGAAVEVGRAGSFGLLQAGARLFDDGAAGQVPLLRYCSAAASRASAASPSPWSKSSATVQVGARPSP